MTQRRLTDADVEVGLDVLESVAQHLDDAHSDRVTKGGQHGSQVDRLRRRMLDLSHLPIIAISDDDR